MSNAIDSDLQPPSPMEAAAYNFQRVTYKHDHLTPTAVVVDMDIPDGGPQAWLVVAGVSQSPPLRVPLVQTRDFVLPVILPLFRDVRIRSIMGVGISLGKHNRITNSGLDRVFQEYYESETLQEHSPSDMSVILLLSFVFSFSRAA